MKVADKTKKKAHDSIDQETVVAQMNMEGMPWYHREDTMETSVIKSIEGHRSQEEPLSQKETRQIIWGALKAACLMATIFTIVGVLVLLFVMYVWL